MKTLRSTLSLTLSFALIALSPGLGSYHAAAQMVTPAASGAVSAPAAITGAVPVRLGAGLASPSAAMPLAPAPGLTQAALSLSPNLLAAPSAVSRTAAASGVSAARMAAAATAATTPRVGASAVAQPASAARGKGSSIAAAAARSAVGTGQVGRPTALQGLQRELPDYRPMGADAARGAWDADMAARLGEGSGGLQAGAAVMGTGAASSSRGAAQLRKAGKRMPEQGRAGPGFEEGDADGGRSSEDVSNLDELGNPRREQSDGPDSVSDEFGGGGRGGSDLFSLLPTVLSVGLTSALAALGNIAFLPVYLGIIVPSLILHEMGHAKAAERLGDPTARLAGRLSWRPKDLLTHIDPVLTIVLPLFTILTSGMILGGARPVQVNPNNFLDPNKDMAKVALAGPAVNVALAILGGFGHAAALAIGMPVVGSVLSLFIFFNVMLALFNLMPFAPLDGSHVVRWALRSKLVNSVLPGYSISSTLDRHVGLQMGIGILALITLLGGPLLWLTQALTGVFMGGAGLLAAAHVGTAQLASAALPAVAAVGLMIGSIIGKVPEGVKKLNGPVEARIASGRQGPAEGPAGGAVAEPVKLLVRLTGSSKPLPRFVHMELVARPTRTGLIGQAEAAYYAETYTNMVSDLEAAGLGAKLLEQYGASPIATYSLINTATLLVPADKASALRSALEARGFRVDDNKKRRIIEPVTPEPNRPDAPQPDARGAVTMPETRDISEAGPALAKGQELWGPPEVGLGFTARLTLRVLRWFGAKVPEVPVAVIDSGVDLNHKQLKRIKEAKNVTTGPNVDDIGHGTWVHSMVLWYAPWLKSSTHYKTFVDGGATTDDILKALSLARQDGNIIMSNSWGSDDGDPEGPDSKLVYEMAAEGRIMVFAAGNSGSRKNTVGSPAIMHYKDPKTGAVRVVSVAATDREKRVAYFSSRGPGSPKTSTDERYKDWPHRPDLAEEGYNTEAAWPTNMRPDRVDPALGGVKAISGTSMSTPKVAGTIALFAMLFGVTEIGPKLDAIVNAVMGTLTPGGNADDVGRGFNRISAAFAELSKTMAPVLPNRVARAIVRSLVG